MYTVASLFAGMGGFALAFRRQGFRALWANELDKYAALTYRHNNPESDLVEGDVKDFSPRCLKLPVPDVLTAGFPCQPFSQAGDRLGFEDHRGVAYQHIIRILQEFGADRPPILLLENVPHLLWHEGGRTYAQIESELRAVGYWMLPYNVARLNTRIHTDIPHNRERLFVVALSTSVFKGARFPFPLPVQAQRKVRDFLNVSVRADDYYYFDVANNRFGQMLWRTAQTGSRDSVYQLRRFEYRADKAFDELKNISAIFEVIKQPDAAHACVEYDLTRDKIAIVLPEAVYDNYRLFRSRSPHRESFVCSLVLPGLTAALETLRAGDEEYSDGARWRRVLRRRLAEIERTSFPSEDAFKIAQELLDFPYGRALNAIRSAETEER